jgi:hypothetical protein
MRPSTITIATTTFSNWIPVDWTRKPFELGVQIKNLTTTTTATWKVQLTSDDIFDPDVTAVAIDAPSPFEAGSQAANEIGVITVPCRAVRLNVTAVDAANSVTMTVLQGRS